MSVGRVMHRPARPTLLVSFAALATFVSMSVIAASSASDTRRSRTVHWTTSIGACNIALWRPEEDSGSAEWQSRRTTFTVLSHETTPKRQWLAVYRRRAPRSSCLSGEPPAAAPRPSGLRPHNSASGSRPSPCVSSTTERVTNLGPGGPKGSSTVPHDQRSSVWDNMPVEASVRAEANRLSLSDAPRSEVRTFQDWHLEVRRSSGSGVCVEFASNCHNRRPNRGVPSTEEPTDEPFRLGDPIGAVLYGYRPLPQ